MIEGRAGRGVDDRAADEAEEDGDHGQAAARDQQGGLALHRAGHRRARARRALRRRDPHARPRVLHIPAPGARVAHRAHRRVRHQPRQLPRPVRLWP